MSDPTRRKSTVRWIALSAAVLVALGSCASQIVIAPVEPPGVAAFPRELVRKGGELAAIGNCVTCHTARNGGKPYAGGFPLKTPFGTVYGTNITPDPETGIGRWSLAAFDRAMRQGVDREGRHLYPAFPYDHFTKTTDEDVRALYAFVMTREPVKAENLPNTVFIPRPFVAIWKALYFEPGVFQPNPNRDSGWNRGAYLVEGLGHCGACHTPRNKLGAEKKDEHFAGGEVGGWHGPALNAAAPSPVPWTTAAMAEYLRTGLVENHAVPAGPMLPVVRNLSEVSREEVTAIAGYVVSLDNRSEAERQAMARQALGALPRAPRTVSGDAAANRGATVYAGACADCHDRGRAEEGGALPLPLATGLTIPTSANLIRITRDGIIPQPHERRPWMPAYAEALTDEQLADLVIYLRAISGRPAWSDVASEIRKAARDDE